MIRYTYRNVDVEQRLTDRGVYEHYVPRLGRAYSSEDAACAAIDAWLDEEPREYHGEPPMSLAERLDIQLHQETTQ